MKQMEMPPMGIFRHVVAYISLGLLCGWYYFLLLLIPLLIILCFHGSYIAGVLLLTLITLTFTPLVHEPWEAFMYSWIFGVWREYFSFSFDCTSIQHGKLDVKEKYMFLEFPHGVFPMGQVISASVIDDIAPGQMITGTAADVVFKVPVMRQFMAWLGTLPAKRENITKIFKKGYRCAVVPGGIAEMYLVSDTSEGLYLKKRQSTIKAAIQEGAHIVPAFFFGNSRLFHILGASSNKNESWISKFSRKFRASILLFYGRNGLPVPYRQHLHMATGLIINVKQNDNPSEEEVNNVLGEVIMEVMKLYERKKPSWEDRPLVIQ